MTKVCEPMVTVAIPTYKGAKHLGAAIESVLGQTFGDFELLIVDDNSPDETRSIVGRFSDRRLVYVRNERNLGPEGNWNHCLKLASGKYFKLLPHDDVLYPHCLERQVATLESDHGHKIALVFSARRVLSPDGRILTTRGYPGGHQGAITGAEMKRACVRRGTNLVGEPGAVLFRKSLADRVGQFDATNPYVIDLDYWFRLLTHGDAYYVAEPQAGFRVSSGSWSVTIGTGQGREFREFIARVMPSTTLFDQLLGRITPHINNLGRLIFYHVHLR